MTDVDYDDLIKDDKERKALEKYNINNEMDISSVGRQRFPAKSNQEEEDLLCRCEGHMKMRCSEKCTSVISCFMILIVNDQCLIILQTNWWRDHRCVNFRRVPDRQQPKSVAW